MSSSPKTDNRKNDILILSKGPTQGLEHTQKIYSINFTENNKKLCLSLHYKVATSYLFVNGIEIYKFKAKDSKLGPSQWTCYNFRIFCFKFINFYTIRDI